MHPELFRIPGLDMPITAYGTMVLLGVVAGLLLLRRGARRRGWDPSAVLDVGTILVFAGILGGRVFYVVQFWDDHFEGKPWHKVFAIWEGGLVLYGALIGGGLALLVLLRRRGWPLLDFFDAASPGVAAGIALGRIGCLLNGCCWGKVCHADYPLGLHYPPGALPGTPLPLHPTQLYESAAALLLCLLLWRLDRNRPGRGAVFGGLALGYGAIRFCIERLRGDHVVEAGGWPVSQWISVGAMVLGLFLLLRARGRGAGPVSVPAEEAELAHPR